MNNVFRMVCSASIALVIGCAPNFQNAGGSSQQGNGVVMGKVLDMLGHPAAKAVVSLYPAEYDPVRDAALPQYSTDTTDSSGRYELGAPESARKYNIVVSAVGANAAALMQGVTVHGDTTPVADLKVTSPGDVFVTLPDNADRINGYVYIPGTGAYARLGSSGNQVELKAVPAGIISRISYCAGNNSQPQVIRYSVPVQSGAGVTVFNPGWRFARLLYLNTTASGANVASDVENFPALIRLTSANFDFSQAQANGADIRFTKTDNAFLPYEIERWDSAAGRAEIWVRVDTVRGNNDNQSITMYWGSASAADSSNGDAVFDTANGFQGVWHLAEGGNATAFDATINHYNGTPAGMTSAIAGIIGQAQQFNGSSSSITMPNTAAGKLDFPENGTYSMSLWVCADTIDTLWHAIAGKGHEQYYMQYKCFGKNKATWEFVEFHDQKGWEYCEDSTPPAPGPKQWLYLVGVRSGTSQRLYVNGEPVIDTAALMPGSYARNAGDNFSIGRYERSVNIPYYQGWSYFKGSVDEVRVSRGAPTADWIKLCYMNQKSDDALVVFDQY
jgi:hypothetical protein